MIKLIVTDMDGTLLGENHHFPSDFQEVFQELYKREILFCVASGRQYPSLLQFFKSVHHQMGFIAENGGYVLLKEQEIYEDTIDNQNVTLLLDICQTIPNIGVALCGKKGAYLNASDSETYYNIGKYYPVLHQVTDLYQVDDAIFKIAIFDKNNPRNNSYQRLKLYENQFKIVVSGDKWLDITNLSVNKGVALKQIQQKLGISPQETMVFGDYLNDLELMQTAYFSYAMKNAQPEVKQVANFVTEEDNVHSGVLKTIRKVLNI
ncbi:HAD family hydrolase [Capnocytophaga catalasegens]|nr:HAD family hydrolase [Capnocytophaga catalasegens]